MATEMEDKALEQYPWIVPGWSDFCKSLGEAMDRQIEEHRRRKDEELRRLYPWIDPSPYWAYTDRWPSPRPWLPWAPDGGYWQ